LAPGTVNLRLGAVRRLAYDAADCGLLSSDLAAGIRQDEVVRLIEAAPNRLYRMILVLLYATGVRRTEAARIKVEDIDSQRMVTRASGDCCSCHRIRVTNMRTKMA
jgi:integrase